MPVRSSMAGVVDIRVSRYRGRRIVRQTTRVLLVLALVLAFMTTFGLLSYGQTQQTLLTRHVREEVGNGQAQLVGRLPATETLNFDIVLPLRDRAGLQSLLREQYDPASPFYHQFLTPRRLPNGLAPARKIGTHWLHSRKRTALKISAEPATHGTCGSRARSRTSRKLSM